MRLVLRLDGQDIEEFVLDKDFISIGRTPNNDITISNLAVSIHHASVNKTPGGAEIVDMKSGNGTFVNDKKITRKDLEDGDIIGIGKHQILFFAQSAFTAPGSDEQSEATVMMSADFQQQLQEELSKSKAANRTLHQQPKKGLWAKLKDLFGF